MGFILKPSADGKVAVATATDKTLDNAARSYRTRCAEKVKQITSAYNLGRIKSWADVPIENIPPTTTCQPFSWLQLNLYLIGWLQSAEARFKLAEQQRRTEVAEVSTRFEASESVGMERIGRFKLRPRQRKSIDAIIAAFRGNHTHAVMCPLEGGEGKSVIAWAVVDYFQKNNWFGHPSGRFMLPNQAIFCTGAAVKIDMQARARACAIANVGAMINVISHTEWASQKMAHFFVEETVEHFGQTTKRLKYIMPPPILVIVDECDAYKKPTSAKSKYLDAIIRATVAAGGYLVYMSATPGVTVNDMWALACSTGRTFNDEPLTLLNYSTFAKTIAARAFTVPSANSERAMLEFRKEFSECYVVPPRDPRKVRAYNSVMLLEFETDADRQFYARTLARYREELDRCGAAGASVNKMTAFLKFRQAEEWLKVPYFVKLALDSWRKGLAPVIGLSFEASVNEVVRQLVLVHGIPRSKISVIQGGSELITREKLAQIIGPELFDNIGVLINRYYTDEDNMSKAEKIAVRKYLKWTRERVKFEESEALQAQRHAELRSLRLGKQTLAHRHEEKERFQNGDTEFMVFTLSSGGRGIDMDHQFEGVRQRVGYFTICYWAEEFLQALYRLMRVATLTDVHQYMVFFAGTEVANHVAPRLDRKIKSVRAGVTGGKELADEAIELLARSSPAPVIKQADLRTGDDTVDDMDHGDVESEIEELELELEHESSK